MIKKLMMLLVLPCFMILFFPSAFILQGYVPDYETFGHYSYYVESDGSATIVSYSGTETDVFIPATMNSHPVRKIGMNAFISKNTIVNVVIPDGVTTIDTWSFFACGNLESITIPGSVTAIGNPAISFCPKLTEVNVSSSNLFYSSAQGALLDKDMSYFIFCPQGISGQYVVPDSVTEIGENAFSNCNLLTKIVLPDNLERIGFRAFAFCNSLNKIFIPSSIQYIDGLIFDADDTTVISCVLDSYAHGYAEFHGLDFELVPYVTRTINGGRLNISEFSANGVLKKETIYYGDHTGSGVQRKNFYNNGIRISYRNYNTQGQLVSIVELHDNGAVYRIHNYTNGVRTHYRLFDTQGRMTHLVECYPDGSAKKTNYYNVSTGLRTRYRLYDTAGRTTHIVECYPNGQAQKTNYYNALSGVRTHYRLYDTAGRTTHIVFCDAAGNPTQIRYYDSSGKLIRVVHR